MAKSREKREERRAFSAKMRAACGDGSGERPSLKVPPGTNLVTWTKSGKFRYDFLLYRLKKKHGNKFATRFGLGEGDLYFERTYFTHKLFGAGNESYACLKLNFGKACPVCEHVAKLQAEGADWKTEIKPHKAKVRQLFPIIDLDEKEKGVQVFDSSHYGFGELLDTRINSADDDQNYDQFADLRHGKTLRIIGKEQEGMKNFVKAVSIEFEDRKPYDESILDKVPNLDDMVQELPYAELKKLYFAAPEMGEGETGEEETEEDSTPKRSTKPSASTKPSRNASSTNDGDDDLDDADSEVEEPDGWGIGQEVSFRYQGKTRIGKIKKINATNELAMVDWGGKELASVDFEDLTAVDDDETDDEPEEPKKKPGKKPAAKQPDPEDDEDDDLDGDSDLEEPEEEDEEDEDDSALEFDDLDEDEEEDEKPQRGKKPAAAGKKPGKK